MSPSVTVEPGEEAFDDPAARLDGKAGLTGVIIVYDHAGDHGGLDDLLAQSSRSR